MNHKDCEQFYKAEVFKMFNDRFDALDLKVNKISGVVDDLNGKYKYILGLATAITFVVNIAWVYLKDKIIKVS